MTMTMILRITAALAAIQGIAHGALFLGAKPRHGPAEEAVVAAMKTNRFDFAGATRSYWDFYTGYGIEAAGACLIEAVLLWQLARIAGTQPATVRPILLLLVFANLAHIALTARYFFYVPIVFDVALIACLGWALAMGR